MTPENKLKQSERMKERYRNGTHPVQIPESRQKIAIAYLGKKHTEEWKRAASERLTRSNPMNDSDVRARHRETIHRTIAKSGHWTQTAEGRAKIGVQTRRQYAEGIRTCPSKNPEVACRIGLAQRGKKKNISDEGKRRHSEALKRHYADGSMVSPSKRPEVRKKIGEAQRRRLAENPEALREFRDGYKKWSASMPKEWKSELGRKARAKAKPVRVSSLERRIDSVCKRFGLHLRHVGDGRLWLKVDGRMYNPDFIEMNGKLKIVEVFGDYWHRNGVRLESTEEGRKAVYSKLGYDTLVLWEREIKPASDEDLAAKISAFLLS